jgi:hypothetical protein
VFDRAGLPELQLERLDDVAAAALLDARAPDLLPAVRERVLAEAAGNPLALVELPIAMRVANGAVSTGPLPLTARLEQAFAARVSELPAATRLLLRVAALDEGDVLSDMLAAAAVVDDGQLLPPTTLYQRLRRGWWSWTGPTCSSDIR